MPNNATSENKTKKDIYKKMAGRAFKYSFYFGLIATIFLIFYSLGTFNSSETTDRSAKVSSHLAAFLNILGVVTILAFASIAAGGVIGFLFGIPHTTSSNSTNGSNSSDNSGNPTNSESSNNTNNDKSNFKPSTNLEQIADWLTKIIVGVGLVEIHKIIDRFNQLCISLGNVLKSNNPSEQNGSLVVGSIIVLFSILGFLLVYLWTYLYLIKIQESLSKKDVYDIIKSQAENDKKAIDLASAQLSLKDDEKDYPVNDLAAAFKCASASVLSDIFKDAVNMRKRAWTDIKTIDAKKSDYDKLSEEEKAKIPAPDDVANKKAKDQLRSKIKRTIPIFQALIQINNNFESPRNYAELAFSLKDSQDPTIEGDSTSFYKNALDNLTKAIKLFKSNDEITNKAIIYFNRAWCNIKLDPNYNTAPSTKDIKDAIIADLQLSITEAKASDKIDRISKMITDDPVVKNWENNNGSVKEILGIS